METCGTDGPGTKRDQHTTSGDEEERSAAEFVDHETHPESHSEVHNLENAVDLKLFLGFGNSNSFQDIANVVRDKTIARPLREEAEGDEDDESMAIALGLEKLKPSVAFKFFLESDSLADLVVFDLDQFIMNIPVCVCCSQDV